MVKESMPSRLSWMPRQRPEKPEPMIAIRRVAGLVTGMLQLSLRSTRSYLTAAALDRTQPLWTLAAADARFDCVEGGVAIGDRVNHFVRAGSSELSACTFETRGPLGGSERGEIPGRQTDHIAGASDANRPHSRVQSFLDVDRSVADLDDSLERLDLQAYRVGEDHPRMRASGADVIGSDRAIGRIALLGGGPQHQLEHRVRVTGGASDLHAAFANSCGGGCNAVDHG